MDPVSELLKPKQELTCAYTHYSMGLLEEMLRFIGKDAEADEAKEYADGSYRAYHTHWVKNKTIETGHMAELVRPIALGLLTEEEKKNAAAALNEMVIQRRYKVGTGFLSTPFVLQTLAENGYKESAYGMLENEQAPGWLAMVNQGATTVCGVRVIGKNRVRLCPLPGGSLTEAEAKVQTAYGTIFSAWKKQEDGTVSYRFHIPANVIAELELADGRKKILSAGQYMF